MRIPVKIFGVLLAPNDPSRPSSPMSDTASSPRDEAALNYLLISLCVGLLTYSLITGLGIASGRVAVERAYLLMTPIPLALALWNAFGFVRSRMLEWGLVASALGWVMAFLTLLLKHSAVQSALSQNLSLADVKDGALTWFCALLAIVLLVVGALLCMQSARTTSNN